MITIQDWYVNGWRYIAREKNCQLYLYKSRPTKDAEGWRCTDTLVSLKQLNHAMLEASATEFVEVKYSDADPTELLYLINIANSVLTIEQALAVIKDAQDMRTTEKEMQQTAHRLLQEISAHIDAVLDMSSDACNDNARKLLLSKAKQLIKTVDVWGWDK